MSRQYTNDECPTCEGIGMVPIAPQVRGVKRCPHCRGSGIVRQLAPTDEKLDEAKQHLLEVLQQIEETSQ